MSKDLRNRCKSDLSLNRQGREKEFILSKKEKKNAHVAQIKEPARYVRTQFGVTAGADMMFNDPTSAMKAGYH